MAFISSRTTRSMLRSTRSPSGSQLYEPGRDGPDVAGADQQLVAGDFGVGGIVTQRAQEQLGHPGDHSAQA